MKFGQQLENNIVPEWKKFYISYEDLKKLLFEVAPATKLLSQKQHHDDSQDTFNLLGTAFDKFYILLEKDLEKVTRFFQDRYTEFDERVNFLREQAYLVESLENNTTSLRYLSLRKKKDAASESLRDDL